MESEYDQYLRDEWKMFSADFQRAQASLDAVHGPVKRVLDIGCGAGQEMLPFVRRGALGTGVDIASHSGIVGCELFRSEGLASQVVFLRSSAELLPFASSVFDVIICRLALPYTDNATALGEMERVLAPNGVVLLKIHHAGFYINKFLKGLQSGKVLPAIHASRVLLSGLIYHVTGKQMRNRLVTNETFQTRWLLLRELDRHGLAIDRLMPDSNWKTPSFIIARQWCHR